MKKEIGMKVKGVVIVKVKGLSIMLFSIVALSFSPVVSLATSSKEDSVKKESVEISSKIDKALDSVNAKYQEVETLKAEVSATEKTIQETQVNIEKTEASIAKRTEAMAERMQHMQSNSSSFNLVDALLSAENMSDFFNRAYAVTVLQGAEKSKVDSLAEDKMKLEELRADLEKNKSELTQKEATMAQEAATLESGVASLKEELNNNQEVLAKLSNDRIAEESRAKKAAAEEANRKEVEKQIQKKAEEESTTSSEKTPDATENTQVTPDPKPPVTTEPSTPDYGGGNNNGGGATMNMVATGYSYTQPGLSFYTATGIDLRVNSRVIAVDPNTIPLGSLVEVSGYGMAIAGDTGGDIVGNRIDVHFNSEEECWNWGRRNVTVTMR